MEQLQFGRVSAQVGDSAVVLVLQSMWRLNTLQSPSEAAFCVICLRDQPAETSRPLCALHQLLRSGGMLRSGGGGFVSSSIHNRFSPIPVFFAV